MFISLSKVLQRRIRVIFLFAYISVEQKISHKYNQSKSLTLSYRILFLQEICAHLSLLLENLICIASGQE